MSKKIFISLCIICLCMMSINDANAQRKRKSKKEPAKSEQALKKDSTKKKSAKGPVHMDKFIKHDTKVIKGLTPFFKQEGKYYIKVNDSLIGRDLLLVSRISRGGEGLRIMRGFMGYAGDELNDVVVRFEKGPENKIFLIYMAYNDVARKEMKDNVARSNEHAIIYAFDVKARCRKSGDEAIDITGFLNQDSEYAFVPNDFKKAANIKMEAKDKSYIDTVLTFPINTELKVTRTYVLKNDQYATIGINASLVMLPKVPMTARYFDERVGYFTTNYDDFDKDPLKVERTRLICRWRLQPKPQDIEKYKRGELVEPANPIVFYIDPETPRQWVPYLIQGVKDWEPAFEKAGFKNAITAKVAPTREQDSTWSLEDARHSAIIYKPSSIENASGPHISDPRSGEIIESHVNWYHNVMELLSNWYFVQCSPVDTAARSMHLDPKIMGELIRFVSSHELGHTLGLRHNFIGSNIYPTDKLRDTAFLRKNGHATSIMDYARFNYVAQPGDNIPRELLYPNIGPYDKWAIEWGYKLFPDINNADKEKDTLSKWITEKIKDPIYLFGTESDASDPRMQSEDLGKNQMIANTYGIKNLKFIMKHIIKWTSEPGKGYENLQNYYRQVLTQYNRYIGHVSKYIGGMYYNPKLSGQEGDVHTHVGKTKQEEAMSFLKKNIFEPQLWLVPNDVMNNTVMRSDIIMQGNFNYVFGKLLSKRVMLNLYNASLTEGRKAYSISDLFSDLNSCIWSPMPADPKLAAYHRMLQKCYVNSLLDLYTGKNNISRFGTHTAKDNSDIISMEYYQIIKIQGRLKTLGGSELERAHYKYLYELISKTLKDNSATGINSKK